MDNIRILFNKVDEAILIMKEVYPQYHFSFHFDIYIQKKAQAAIIYKVSRLVLTKRFYHPSQIHYHIPWHHRFSKNQIV